MKMDSSSLLVTLLSLAVVFSFSLLCGFGPVCVTRRAARFSSDTGVLALASCLSSGVFLASCLLDLLPNYLMDMTDTFSHLGITLRFPLAEFLLAVGFVLVLVLEQLLLALRDHHCSEACVEKQTLMTEAPGRREQSSAGLRLLLLLLCLCERALLDGLSAAARLQRPLQVSPRACVSVLLYEGLLSFSVCVRLHHQGLRRAVVCVCVLLFCVSCPAGMALSLSVSGLQTGSAVGLIRCVVRGLTAGVFINVCVSGLMWPDVGSPKHRIHKVAFLLSGFALVTAVLLSRV